MNVKPKPRILQIIDGLNIGGAEVLLIDLVRGLQDSGYHVSVGYITSGPLEDTLRKMDVSLTRLPHLSRVDPFLLLNICRLILRVRPDVVHTHLFKSDFHGRLAARLCRVPIVISTAHNNDAWARKPLFGFLYGLTNRLVDSVIAVSDEVREYQIQYTHIPPDKIRTIDNGVNVAKFSNQDDAAKAIRAEFNLAASTPLVGIVGRLRPQKDHSNFLKAAAQIREAVPEAKFLIVGDGPLREQLEAEARALGLETSVIFCGVRQDIPAIMAALNVLLISSQWEGLPVTMLEGMASALPIVATAVGGIAGVVENGETALLVPPGDSLALAQTCTRILQDASLAKSLGQAGLKRVTENYSLAAMLRQTLNLYEELLSK